MIFTNDSEAAANPAIAGKTTKELKLIDFLNTSLNRSLLSCSAERTGNITV